MDSSMIVSNNNDSNKFDWFSKMVRGQTTVFSRFEINHKTGNGFWPPEKLCWLHAGVAGIK